MQLSANGITIEVEDHGPVDGEPLLLIMGLGMQLVAWPDELVQLLVERGFRVIRFDNRDVGLSQGFDHLGVPNLLRATVRYTLRMDVPAPYTLDDMAADAFGVLDALGIASAHVCGASMGGMIAQAMAAARPERVRSLTLMMTSSGARHLPQPSLRVRHALLQRPARNAGLDERVDHAQRFFWLIGSPGYRNDPEYMRRRLSASIQRAYRPTGFVRQITAVAAHGDRSPRLRRIAAPTVVIHGEDDPLIPVAAAHDLCAKIAGARADLVPGMGHDLPLALLPRFTQTITNIAERA